MKTLQQYKKLAAESERAQARYNKAVLDLRKETDRAAHTADEASRAWRAKPSPAARKKMLAARKAWAERLKVLEELLGRMYVK